MASMANFRKAFTVLGVASLSFCFVGIVAHVILWHLAGLNNLERGDAGAAAMGAFVVFIKATTWGIAGAMLSAISVIFWLRRKRIAN
jgi:hypothetical protein